MTFISVQPKIIFSGLIESTTYNETDTVTVTCTIDRLYPQIHPANFTMRWGDTVREPVANNNTDGSYAYQVQATKTLTQEDDGTAVICSVNPVRGAPVVEQKTLHIHSIYKLLIDQSFIKIIPNAKLPLLIVYNIDSYCSPQVFLIETQIHSLISDSCFSTSNDVICGSLNAYYPQLYLG